MNYGPFIFLGAFFALAASWFGFVLTPQLQVGQLLQSSNVVSKATWPVGRPGLARQGLDVYRANGCAYCHSQQVGQTGTVFDVLLTEAGTNQNKTVAALIQIGAASNEAAAKELLATLPAAVRKSLSKVSADAGVKRLQAAGAKANIWVVPIGPDLGRGWGKRRTVAEDFLFDAVAPVGSQRIGPDLASVGSRLPDANWHLLHLYAPQQVTPGSTMPSYRYLFETRRIERVAAPDALVLPAGWPASLNPPAGHEIVPREEARALVAYLTSLQPDAPLFVAPFSEALAPPASTNAPATNAPAK